MPIEFIWRRHSHCSLSACFFSFFLKSSKTPLLVSMTGAEDMVKMVVVTTVEEAGPANPVKIPFLNGWKGIRIKVICKDGMISVEVMIDTEVVVTFGGGLNLVDTAHCDTVNTVGFGAFPS
ncbi:hypothetical protein L1887_32012 [Cichorium endivia]|nr:hypothetical protein L1887_32012 [Cichorium endivia]